VNRAKNTPQTERAPSRPTRRVLYSDLEQTRSLTRASSVPTLPYSNLRASPRNKARNENDRQELPSTSDRKVHMERCRACI
jgi:hypothetical protein